MQRIVRILAAITCVAAVHVSVPSWAQSALSATDVKSIKADVGAAMIAYVKVYSARDVRTMVDKVYATPAFALGPNGATLLTPEKLAENFDRQFKALPSTYDHSEFGNPTVCVLSGSAAIASGSFKRINKDGSVLLEASSSYLFTKTSDGWKAVAALGVQKNKVVSCD